MNTILFRNRNIFKNKKWKSDLNDFDRYLCNLSHHMHWLGYSIQTNNFPLNAADLDVFFNLFKKSIMQFETTDKWVIFIYQVNKLFPWFTNNELDSFENLNLVFNNIKSFKGYIEVDKEFLFVSFKDLFYLSSITNSQDVLIMNTKVPYFIKFSNHLDMDMISIEESLVEFVTKSEFSNLKVKKYQ